jgi:hypothetical protein
MRARQETTPGNARAICNTRKNKWIMKDLRETLLIPAIIRLEYHLVGV